MKNQILLKEIPMLHKNVSWSIPLVLVSGALFAIPASAQHFEQVKGTLKSVAAGRNEVFGIDAKGLPWRYRAGREAFTKVSGATSLVQIAVGGGTVSQLDEVWALATGGALYHFNFSTGAFDKVSAPEFSQIAVGEGVEDNCHPYEVWGVVDGSSINRYSYCSNSFELLNSGPWSQVATGGGTVWGIDGQDTANLFFNGGFLDVGGPVTQIAEGVNDMWAINSDQILHYDPNTSNGFVQISGTLKHIAAGGDGVWGVNAAGETFRWDFSSGALVQVPTTLASIAVGSGAGVWGVNSSDEVFTFVRP
jgi:hypothetical protein